MYLLAKLSYSASLLVAIIAVTFILFHAMPSDPARTILGPQAAEEQLASFRRAHGLDKPIHVQLGKPILTMSLHWNLAAPI